MGLLNKFKSRSDPLDGCPAVAAAMLETSEQVAASGGLGGLSGGGGAQTHAQTDERAH